MTRDRPTLTDFVADFGEVERCRHAECYQQELRMHVMINIHTVQLVTPQRSEIMGGYNAPDTVVRDRNSKSVMK